MLHPELPVCRDPVLSNGILLPVSKIVTNASLQEQQFQISRVRMRRKLTLELVDHFVVRRPAADPGHDVE